MNCYYTSGTWYDVYKTATIYLYNASLCGTAEKSFKGKVALYGLPGNPKLILDNLSIITFGFNCNFNQSAAITDQSFQSIVTYSPASLNLTLRNLIYVYGNIYVPSSNVPCGSMRLTVSYGSNYYIWNSTARSWYPIGQVNVYAINPNCPMPTFAYSSATSQVLIQLPNSTLAIPATMGAAYLTTRSLSWSFQAIVTWSGWVSKSINTASWGYPYGGKVSCPTWQLTVYSGNNTVTDKTVTESGECQTILYAPSPFGNHACYTSYNGPSDISLYPANGQTSNLASVSVWDVYATYNITTICNGNVTSWQLERLETGVQYGTLTWIQDPFTGEKCPISDAYVNTTWYYVGCK
jgi:hypothetical protein